jgi:hypothetical protein
MEIEGPYMGFTRPRLWNGPIAPDRLVAEYESCNSASILPGRVRQRFPGKRF